MLLLTVSLVFNFSTGYLLTNSLGRVSRKTVLTLGILANLALLGYYKYANFFIENTNWLFETGVNLGDIVLPLAISFFTFQQIAYLADAYKGEAKEYSFLHYTLFVTFFPQLIAGPIVHHREILPQFTNASLAALRSENLAIGGTMFIFGLFKKVVLADGVSVFVAPVFGAAEAGVPVPFIEAWIGVTAYTLQLYFDFSGYSDMAIGLARMFGIRLPLNFNSPYKSASIIDFWRRWHMTLSRFLRDYVYIPLGGNRNGEARRMGYLMTTMLLGGLWHGAGWTFVMWGGLHGLYLMVNHFWRRISPWSSKASLPFSGLANFCGWGITMLAVMVAWVPFRASSMAGTERMLLGMSGLNGFVLPERYYDKLNSLSGLGDSLMSIGVQFDNLDFFPAMNLLILVLTGIIAFLLPNTQQLMYKYKPVVEDVSNGLVRPMFSFFEWRPSLRWAFLTVVALVLATASMTNISEFLYYQF